MKDYLIAEIFGPTIQGEGPLAGMPCSFIRFAGCDFKCIWCDSPHAVLPKYVREARRLSTNSILAELHEGNRGVPDWIVFSGGNPALYDLTQLVGCLHEEGKLVAVETQASRWQDWLLRVDQLVMSPKPPSALQPDTLDSFIHNYQEAVDSGLPISTGLRLTFKVVVFDEEDLRYADSVHSRYPAIPFYLSCGNIPQEVVNPAATASDLGEADGPDQRAARYAWLAERISGDRRFRDVRVLPQLHVYAWGNERGR